VLDSSALLAYLHQEQGGLQVRPWLPFAFMSTVNGCEVAQKLREKSVDDRAIRGNLEILGLQFMAFSVQHAEKVSELWQFTASFGLSLGDRAGLATGLIKKMPIMTADKIWQDPFVFKNSIDSVMKSLADHRHIPCTGINKNARYHEAP
jgi:PIN domain nuclease of toxin-antitoxin system